MALRLASLPVSSPNVTAPATILETAEADLWQCGTCGMVQMKTKIDAEFQYHQFQYSTGISVGLREHFADLIEGLAEAGEITAGRFVLDIGSNDGSLLKYAKVKDCKVLGIDPAKKIAELAIQAGIPTIADFFDGTNAKNIRQTQGPADVIISNNTVANIDDLDTFFDNILHVLADDGIVVIETQYVLDVLHKFLLDVIYHEHINYFAIKPFEVFLERKGLALIDAEKIAPKGGSIRFVIQRKGGRRPVRERLVRLRAEEEISGLYSPESFGRLEKWVGRLSVELQTQLKAQRVRHGRALVWGASVGCAALINYLGLAAHIDAIFDDTPLNNYVIAEGRLIPVLSGSQIRNEQPSDVLVLAWRYTEVIANKYHEFVQNGGQFIPVINGKYQV